METRWHQFPFACPICHTPIEPQNVWFSADMKVAIDGVCHTCNKLVAWSKDIAVMVSLCSIQDRADNGFVCEGNELVN